MRELIVNHPALFGMGVFFLFSNAVGALAKPTEKSNGFYVWFFAFSHGLAGNVKYALSKALPQYFQQGD